MSRSTLLSSRKTIVYQVLVTTLFAVFPLLFLYYGLSRGEYFYAIGMSLTYGFVGFRLISRVWKLKGVSYDRESIYILHRDYEQQVPLEEVRDLKLRDASGIHSINLGSEHGNKEIFFKTSLWYPLNFMKIDDEIGELRERIEQARRDKWKRPDVDAGRMLN